MESVTNYDKKCNLKEKLIYTEIQSEKVIVNNFIEIKTWGINDLSRIFLKNGAKSASQN